MRLFLIFLCCAGISAADVQSGTKAYLEDGTTVELLPDGSWKPIPQTKAALSGFRGVAWGSNEDAVKAAEGKQPEETAKNLLVYEDAIENRKASVGYLFVEGRLYMGKYMFDLEHMNENDFVADFNAIGKALIGKYGDPSQNETFWKNDLFKKDPTRLGMAIAAGHVAKAMKWEDQDQYILLWLSGDNMKIKLSLEYGYKPLQEVEKQRRQEKQRSKL